MDNRRNDSGAGRYVRRQEWAEKIASRLREGNFAPSGSTAIDRRSALGLIGLGAGAVGAATALGRSFPAAAQSGKYTAPDGKGKTLTVSVWGGSTEKAFVNAVVPVFKSLTGADVVFETGSGGQRFNKLVAQGDISSVDVFINSGENVYQANRLGKVVDIDPAKVPNMAQIYDWARLFPYGVSYGLIAFGLTYSSKVDPLTSWADLWRPDLKGRLGMPAIGHTQFPMFLITLAEMFGGSAENIDPAIDRLAELDPAVLSYFWVQWADAGKAGKVLAIPEFNYSLLDARAAGIDFNYGFPKEKAIAADNTMSIAKGSANTDLAHAFLNVTFDADVQAEFCAHWLGSPTNRNAKIAPSIQGRVPLAADILDKVRFFDLAFIAGVRAEWTEKLNSRVLAKWK